MPETLLACLTGGTAGCLLAALAANAAGAALRKALNLGVTQPLVHITPLLLMGALAGAMILGLVAGLWPAWRAFRLRPMNAIRSED